MSGAIPAEAVEAAMAAFLLESIKRKGELSEKPMALLAALEAAAPHLMATAWAEGLLEGKADERSGFDTAINPYRTNE